MIREMHSVGLEYDDHQSFCLFSRTWCVLYELLSGIVESCLRRCYSWWWAIIRHFQHHTSSYCTKLSPERTPQRRVTHLKKQILKKLVAARNNWIYLHEPHEDVSLSCINLHASMVYPRGMKQQRTSVRAIRLVQQGEMRASGEKPYYEFIKSGKI